MAGGCRKLLIPSLQNQQLQGWDQLARRFLRPSVCRSSENISSVVLSGLGSLWKSSLAFSALLSPDEDHFSPEADAAVSEMTRGAVLVAQVLHTSTACGWRSLVAGGPAGVPKPQSLAPGKSWGWEFPSALLGTGKG